MSDEKNTQHDARGTFFFRSETTDLISWNVARFPSNIKDEAALQAMRDNAYFRAETSPEGKHTYIKVSVMLATTRGPDIEIMMRKHMGMPHVIKLTS